ncbi:PilZ domain-containing protein [Persephonella sp.]
MIEIIKGKRYLGELEKKRVCEKPYKKINFKMLFSFEVQDIMDDKIKICKINPYQLNSIMHFLKNFKIYINECDIVYIVNASIIEGKDDIYLVHLDKKSRYVEKRKFHRFNFCCEDLGKFKIIKNNQVISGDACIVEISRTGLKILTRLHRTLHKKDILTVESISGNTKFEIEVVNVTEEDRYHILRVKIIETNINLVNYIIDGYVRTAEKLILKGS